MSIQFPGILLNLPADHPALAGHFPGNPIIPGVVLLDESLHAIEKAQAAGSGMRPWQIGTVKFHHIVRPGDAVHLTWHRQADGGVQFELRTSTALVASGTASQHAPASTVTGPP
jgi:3-hydroxyacyl-[acyl-carrier-protein] dehydratase